MNQSKLYVPNPQKWIDYFKNNKPQVRKGFAIPHKSSTGRNSVTINTVSPAEQTVNQAKSELKRDGLKTSEVSSLVRKLADPLEVTHPANNTRKRSKKTTKQSTSIKNIEKGRKNVKKGGGKQKKKLNKRTENC